LGQIAYLTPWLWWPAVVGLYALARGRFKFDATENPSTLNVRVFLLALAMPATLIFLFVAARKPVLPHWSLVGLIPAFPLVGQTWALLLASANTRTQTVHRLRFATGFVIIAAGFVSLHSHFGLIPWARLGPIGQKLAKVDMTLDGQIWSGLTHQLAQKGWLPSPDEFIFTSRWYESGLHWSRLNRWHPERSLRLRNDRNRWRVHALRERPIHRARHLLDKFLRKGQRWHHRVPLTKESQALRSISPEPR
jgi:hypothetical protein